ncbi:hypothetical protein K504DRAFT_449567 [Pleomassaria siparia CBS 279.74]|uniref:MFS general substrate transporter n=1 Tax=Pleomassaria siparia CBS 279.74 TaxID=1314801 RepID=A0A6G1JVK8_9PLEO|nr:hypothetical protein K504DRAFT_449567 [Pleomassaria siparia CBS 279.74]
MSLSPTATQCLRYAFALEASLNVLGGIVMLSFASTILPYVTSYYPPNTPSVSPSPSPSSSSVTLLQWLGALSCSLAVPLLVGLPTDVQAPERRKSAYWTLLAGEAFLVPTMLIQAAAGNEERGGITTKALVIAAAVLAPPALGRVYVLLRKPEWFGEEKSIALQE